MNKKQDFIPALGYSQLTSFYDKVIDWSMPEKKFRSKLIQHLSPQPNEQILEFGFGTGQNIIYALHNEFSASYYGLDIDSKVVDIAKTKLKGLKFLKNVKLDLYDGNIFPYSNDSFDKVFSCLVFHQLKTEAKKASMMEIFRVLKPEGRLLICDWGKPHNYFTSLGFYFVQLLDGFETTSDNRNGLLSLFLKEIGFDDVQQIDIVNTKIGTLRYTIATK